MCALLLVSIMSSNLCSPIHISDDKFTYASANYAFALKPPTAHKSRLALAALAVAEERRERHVALALVAQVARDRVRLEGARELARGRVDVADVDLHGGVVVRGDKPPRPRAAES
jgi:hypothetical protein